MREAHGRKKWGSQVETRGRWEVWKKQWRSGCGCAERTCPGFRQGGTFGEVHVVAVPRCEKFEPKGPTSARGQADETVNWSRRDPMVQ